MAGSLFICQLLYKLLMSISTMADEANVFFDHDRYIRFKLVCFVGYVDGAIFFKKESLCNFRCPKRVSARFQIPRLRRILKTTCTNFNHVDLQFDTDERVIHVRASEFRKSDTERILMEPRDVMRAKVPLIEEHTNFLKMDESEFEYDLIIGIPSVHFVRMLADAGVHDFVKIYVKQRDVLFRVKNKAFVLHNEIGRFVRVGPVFDKTVVAEFALYRITTFLIASELTNIVWLCWSSDAPPVLIFPLGPFGSFQIYSRLFHEEKWKRAPAHQLENKQVS
ncbi:hypothetical protein SAY87_020470 [Trapa incisa]|uniref:Uncharacterized protein n=1 Tax=Trapa incisa TaxID=236973 RepID=A0AAN7JRB2_9MYRT|nr:hypothetical protein SAY87_020470 [Trapa incisa]